MRQDVTRLLERLIPAADGEPPLRLRVGVVDAVNSGGTVDVEISGVVVPDVAVLDGATAGVGDNVMVLTGRDLLVLGAVAT